VAGAPRARFLVAKNPDSASSLPYLVRLPIDGGIVLKARAPWPTTARVYCHRHEGGWPESAEIVDDVAVLLCQRRGPAVDLVLDRPQHARSQFVFTEVHDRPAIFWQTQKVARTANPGSRVPRRRALADGLTIIADTRERYPYRFAGRGVAVERAAVTAGDYGVRVGESWLAVVERKSFDNLVGSLADGTLAFQLARLAELPLAAVVVESGYPALFDAPRVAEGWLPDVLTRLQIRYREIPIMFAGSRKFAEEWTYRFLATAVADLADPSAAKEPARKPATLTAMSGRDRRTRAELRRSRAMLVKTRLQPVEEDLSPIRGSDAISLVHRLTRESWSVSGRDEPTYSRKEIPWRFVRGRLT